MRMLVLAQREQRNEREQRRRGFWRVGFARCALLPFLFGGWGRSLARVPMLRIMVRQQRMQREQRSQRNLAFVRRRWRSVSIWLDEQTCRLMAGGTALVSHAGSIAFTDAVTDSVDV